VIAVHVAEQHEVDRPEPRIVAAGHVVRRVVEKAHARRILEDHRAIARAQLAGVRADRRDLHVLGAGRSGRQKKRESCACVCSVHALLLWLDDDSTVGAITDQPSDDLWADRAIC
jgi:hypothetical protein